MTAPSPPRWSEYTLRRRVQFYELDSAGIVHFSTYFRYMEEAEHALWRAAGLSIAPAGSEIGFPRVAAGFDYRRPLRFEEEFEVQIRITGITRRTIRYTCVVVRDGEEVAHGTMVTVCVRKRPNEPMKAVPLPDEITSRFEAAAAVTST